jgi:hypothetical protein
MTDVCHEPAFRLVRFICPFLCVFDSFGENAYVEWEYQKPNKESRTNSDVVRPELRENQYGRKSDNAQRLTNVEVASPVSEAIAEGDKQVNTYYDGTSFPHLH